MFDRIANRFSHPPNSCPEAATSQGAEPTLRGSESLALGHTWAGDSAVRHFISHVDNRRTMCAVCGRYQEPLTHLNGIFSAVACSRSPARLLSQ